MTISEDPSTPVVVSATGTGTITSASFTPPSGSTLVALVAAEKQAGILPVGVTMTDTGNHLWIQQAGVYWNATGGGTLNAYTAYVPVGGTPMTVSAGFDAQLHGGRLLAVRVLTGADPYQTGNAGYDGAPAASQTATSTSITPTAVGSLIYGISLDFTAATTFTVNASTTALGTAAYYQDATDHTTVSVWRTTAASTSTATALTPGGTWGAANRSITAAFEVLPAGTYTTAGLANGGATAHSQWVYDTRLPASLEPARTNAAEAAFEADYAQLRTWFGGSLNLGLVTCVVTSEVPTGASWFGSGATGTLIDITAGLNGPGYGSNISPNYLRYLVYSEVSEMFMQVQNIGWYDTAGGDEGTSGEGLSRFLAGQYLINNGELASGILTSRLGNFADSAYWLNSARVDYINAAPTADINPDAATGCVLLFLYYLQTQYGYTPAQIIAAGSPTNMTAVYHNLTGNTDNPFTNFAALLSATYPASSNNVIAGNNPDNPWPLGNPALREDTSTPGAKFATGTGASIASNAFLPPPGSLILAMTSGEWSPGTCGVALSDSSGLKWQQVAIATGSGRDGGVAAIFAAEVATQPTAAITVTAKFTGLGGGTFLDVRVLVGAASISGITGWSEANASNSNINAEIEVQTSVAGSRVYGISNNPTESSTFTPIGGTGTLTSQNNTVDQTNCTSWIFLTTTPGQDIIGGLWSRNDAGNVCAFEVIPAGSQTSAPALPVFVDGQVPTAAQLNEIATNISNLYNVASGGQRYQYYVPGGKGPIKPLTVLSVTNPSFTLPAAGTSNTGLPIYWDTVLANSDNAWDPLDAALILINTPGLYRLHMQLQIVGVATNDDIANAYTTLLAQILVNGTTPSSNCVATANTFGQAVGVSATLELSQYSMIYAFATQWADGWPSGATTAQVGLLQFAAEWLGT